MSMSSVRSVALALLIALGLYPACAARQPPAPAQTPAASAPGAEPGTPADDLPLPVEASTRVGTLPNGLRTYVRANREPQKRAQLRLVIKAGSVLEEEHERGLAHFVEHMAFNGTRLFKKQEIVDFTEKLGMRFGQHSNAQTGFDDTIYIFEAPTGDAAMLEKAVSMLQQIATDVSFDPAEVERERGVVIEEWREGRGADIRLIEQLFTVLFRGSRYGERLPIGQKSVLEKASADDLRAFYRRWYRPDLMAVIAVGDFDPAVMEGYIGKHFGPLPAPDKDAPALPRYPVPDHRETLVSIAQDKELPMTSVGVLYKLPPRRLASKREYRRSLLERIYHRMVNARLEELTRVENPPFLGATSQTMPFVRTADIFLQAAATKGDGIERGLEALTREMARIDKHGFTPGELEREKLDMLREFEQAAREKDKTPSAGYAEEMVRNFTQNESMPGIERELALVKEMLPGIALPEMNRLAAEWISEGNRVIMVQAPADVKTPPADDLRALFARTDQADIAPYVDRVSTAPLVGALPPPGKIVGENHLAEVGLTEWRLSNGARVLLKPTDFKNDEVLLAAHSFGGHSRVPDKDFVSAEHAAAVIGASGLGSFGPTELRKALAGKVARVSPYIEELEEGLLGNSAPDDLETLFGLVHLTMTAPRRDESVFATYRAQFAEQLARRQVDPQAVFDDEWTRKYYRNHPRRRPPERKDVDKLSLDAMMRVYRERFGDAGDFTFVLVGRIEPDKARPLVEKYLASLPAQKRKDTWKDVGVQPPAGVHRFTVARGEEPKSQVRITFNGPATFNVQERYRLRALTEVLRIRLREVVREDLGGTYGVGVSGGLIKLPKQRFRTEIQFGCAPENADKLIAAVRGELAATKKDGPAPSYLEKVKVAETRALEEGLRSNGHWLYQLVDSLRFDLPPRFILEEKKLIEAIDAPTLRAAARRYFPDDRVLTGVLKPAAAK